MYEAVKKACLVCCAVMLNAESLLAAQGALEIEVSLSAKHAGLAVPVSVELGDKADGLRPSCSLLDKVSGDVIPCQLDKASGSLHLVISTKAEERRLTRRLVLQSETPSREPQMKIVHSDGALVIADQARPVAAYNYRMMLPEGVPQPFRRSSYFHPIYGLDGKVMTDDFPVDHYHHRGLSWMWTHVVTDEGHYDLWGISGIRQRMERVLAFESGPVCAHLALTNGWYTDEGNKLVQETVSIRTYPASQIGRVIDLELVFEALGSPVAIDSSATGYGGFNLRFAPRTETRIVTSDGAIQKDVNRERYLWSDLSGKFGQSDSLSGIAIFDNPANIAHPTGWTLRYYGILNPSFTSISPVTLEPGKPLTVRYRVWVHRGDAESGKVAEAYFAYANPPVVKIKAVR